MNADASVTRLKAHFPIRTVMVVATVLLGVLFAALPSVHASQGSAAGQATAQRSDARAARVISLVASAHLRITQVNENQVHAKGAVSGTISGTLTTHITINSGGRMTSYFTGTSHAGSLTGWGVSNYGVSGSTLYYSGTANITRGTGIYAHAHATGIKIEGTLNRRAKRLTAVINGPLHV